jgi:cytochrome c oxidase assembly factor CtaG
MTTRDLLLHAWTWRPAVALLLAAVFALHFARLRFARPWRSLALGAAASAVAVALASPIDALARGTLFSAHMLQHMLLALVVPPLLLLALPPAPEPATATATRRPGAATATTRPEAPLPGATPSAPRRTPAVAFWAMGVGAMWIWHVPSLCNAAATSDAIRAIQNLSLPAMGLAFWWPILGPRADQRLPDLAAVAYLFTACVACTILGISITFSPVTVCSAYGHAADPLGALPLVRGAWGLTPAVDQQLGGLLMWIPGCTAYAAAILVVVGRFYSAPHVAPQRAS